MIIIIIIIIIIITNISITIINIFIILLLYVCVCGSAGTELDAVCRLATMFIGNVTVSGYSVTANVHRQVDGLLSVMSEHVLTLLHHRCKKTVHTCFASLLFVFRARNVC